MQGISFNPTAAIIDAALRASQQQTEAAAKILETAQAVQEAQGQAAVELIASATSALIDTLA